MAATTLFGGPYLEFRDEFGEPMVGAEVTVFIAGTTTPQAVYHDSDLQNAWAFPITTNADGQSTGPVYVSPTPALKIVVVDSNNVPLPGFPFDDYSPSAVGS